ncbi:unnamed protein product [Cunninghamella blakesleeana]
MTKCQFLKEEITTETTTDIFKYENKKGYAGLGYKKVLEFIGIESKVLFSEDEDIPMKNIDDTVIKDISKILIRLTKVIGIINEGNVAKRRSFVEAIIVGVVENYYDKNVNILFEEIIEGEGVKGPADYVMVYDKCISIVIEAKKDDFEQGRAQLLIQLYNAYIGNIKNGAPKNHIIYRIITTGDQWEFIWCKGNNNINDTKDVKSNNIWNYKYKIQPIEMNLKKKQEQWKERVSLLVKTLNYMIDNSLNQITKNN